GGGGGVGGSAGGGEEEGEGEGARDGAHRHKRQPPVQRQEDYDRDRQAHEGEGGGDEGHLQKAGRRLNVAGQPGKDTARFHIPEAGQRKVQEAIVQSPAQGEHYSGVEQLLAVVLDDADQLGADDRGQEHGPGQVEAAQAVG